LNFTYEEEIQEISRKPKYLKEISESKNHYIKPLKQKLKYTRKQATKQVTTFKNT